MDVNGEDIQMKIILRSWSRIAILGLALLGIVVSRASPKTVYADQYGYNKEDVTTALQAALNDKDADTVIVRNMGSPWIVGRMFIRRDNLTLIFEKGAVLLAKSGAFPGRSDSLMNCDQRKNITIKGYGATFQMRKAEYGSGEWRSCISMNNSTDVNILGLTLRDSGGDGIYIGDSKKTPGHRYCENVLIKDVVIDNCKRNGISVISAKNLLITDCISKNVKGASPEAGLDFEPNNAEESLINCVVKNSRFTGNTFRQFQVNLAKLDSSQTVSILVQNCYFSGEGTTKSFGVGVMGSNAGAPGGGCRGVVEFADCMFKDIPLQAYRLGNNANGMLAKLTRCVFDNVRTIKEYWDDPIRLEGGFPFYSPEYGNLQITDCLFWDPSGVHGYFMTAINERKTFPGCANVKGNMFVVSPKKVGYGVGLRPHNVNIKVKLIAKTPSTSAKVTASTERVNGLAAFTITRTSSNSTIPIAVEYKVTGSAIDSGAYSSLPGFVIIPPGKMTALVPIRPAAGGKSLPASLHILSNRMAKAGDPGQASMTVVSLAD